MKTTPAQVYSARRHHKKRKEKAKAWMHRLKSEAKCADCGFSHPAAIHFHHIGKKTANIAAMMHDGKFAKVERELRQCIALCANCHSIRHYNEDYKESRAANLISLPPPAELNHPEFSFVVEAREA